MTGLLMILQACETGGSAPLSGGTSTNDGGDDDGAPTGKIIFISLTNRNGAYGGFNGADVVCNSDAATLALPGTYKALLSNGSTRVACTTAYCSGGTSENVDWVLQPNTTYLQQDAATVIGTTNAGGVFPSSTSVPFGPGSAQVLTGFATDWTFGGSSCSNFTNTTGAVTYGDESATGTNSWAANVKSCNSATSRIYCVQQ